MSVYDKLYKKALKMKDVSDFGFSDKKDKRFYVVYKNKKINFGSLTGKTYIDHRDKQKRDAWYARHSKIYNMNGVQVINDPNSPSYYSARLLW